MALDPVTAALNAATALFEFLTTPVGQEIAAKFLKLDEQFVPKMHDLFQKIHGKIQNEKE